MCSLLYYAYPINKVCKCQKRVCRSSAIRCTSACVSVFVLQLSIIRQYIRPAIFVVCSSMVWKYHQNLTHASNLWCSTHIQTHNVLLESPNTSNGRNLSFALSCCTLLCIMLCNRITYTINIGIVLTRRGGVVHSSSLCSGFVSCFSVVCVCCAVVHLCVESLVGIARLRSSYNPFCSGVE